MATERKIGGVVYRCDKLPAEPALKLYMKLNEVFAGDQVVLATIASDTGREGALKAFLHASMNNPLDAEKVTGFLGETVGLCRVGADPCIVGVKPADLRGLLAVAWFAMEVNFRDFLAVSLADA